MQAHPFNLPDTDGNLHTLADSRGRWLILAFHRHLG
jgi:peroxiredoxin